MSITHVTSLSQLNGILNSGSNDKLTVIDFHATWCGPCHMIAPVFEALSKQHTGVNFLKCDVDAARDVAGQYKVSAMPTFIFLKGAQKVDQVQGANRGALEAAIRKHSSGSTGTFSGKGHTLGSSSSTSTGTEAPALPDVKTWFNNLDPQARVLLTLLGAYALFWFLS